MHCFITRIVPVLMTSAVLGACAPSLVVECKSPVDVARSGPALVGQEYGMRMSQLPLDAVQFTDTGVAKSIAIQTVRAMRTQTDTVQVVARFVNCQDKPVPIRARTSFMDTTSLPTEPISAWRPIIVPPRATALYQENSTSTNVANYLIEVAADQ